MSEPLKPRALQEGSWVAAALVAALALRACLATRNAGITMDSPTYVTMGESLLAGTRDPAAPAHFGFPALIAGASLLLPGRELPGRVVSFAMSLAVVGLTYALARVRLGPRVSLLAALLVALHPLLGVYGGAIMSESTFLALAFGSLLLVERGTPVWGGVLAGLAFCVRAEAILLALGAAVFGAVRPRTFLLVLAGFAIVAAPYIAFERWERGSWSLTPKLFELHPPPANWRMKEYRLPPAGETGTPSPPGAPGAPSTPPLARSWDVPALAAHYLPSLRHHLGNLVMAWPWPLMALSLVGLVRRRGALVAPLLFLAALPLAGVGYDPRFVLIVLPALAVYAGEAVAWGLEWGTDERRFVLARRVLPALGGTLALVGLAWSWRGPCAVIAMNFDDGPMREFRAAGDWLRAHGHPNALVMDRKSYVPFFAGMRHVQLPDNDYDTIIEGAQRARVDYIVVEEYVVEAFRPQLGPLLSSSAFRAREPRLRSVFAYRGEPGTGVAVFEVVREPRTQ